METFSNWISTVSYLKLKSLYQLLERSKYGSLCAICAHNLQKKLSFDISFWIYCWFSLFISFFWNSGETLQHFVAKMSFVQHFSLDTVVHIQALLSKRHLTLRSHLYVDCVSSSRKFHVCMKTRYVQMVFLWITQNTRNHWNTSINTQLYHSISQAVF